MITHTFKPGDVIEYAKGSFLLVLPDNKLLRLSTGGRFRELSIHWSGVDFIPCVGNEFRFNIQDVLKKVYKETK